MEESITATTKHSQKPAARTARGNDRALKRLETKFAEGDYYEAQQLIKMLMNRLHYNLCSQQMLFFFLFF
jgi:hypothetical protein